MKGKRSPAAKSDCEQFCEQTTPPPALGMQFAGVLGSTLFTLPDLGGGCITKLPRLTFEFVILLPPPSKQLGSRPVPFSAPFQPSAFSPRTLNSVRCLLLCPSVRQEQQVHEIQAERLSTGRNDAVDRKTR